MRLVFVNIFMVFVSCQNSIKHHVELYPNSKTKKCEYSTINERRVGNAYYYDFKGSLVKKINYDRGKITELSIFVNDKLSFKENFVDSNLFIYYPKGNLKSFQKYNHEGVYYYNNYDSITGKIIKCYRDLNEEILINADSIKIKPYAKSIKDKLDNYVYYVAILNQSRKKTDTFICQKKIGVITFKNEKRMKWQKVICDSIGCYSLPVTIGIEN